MEQFTGQELRVVEMEGKHTGEEVMVVDNKTPDADEELVESEIPNARELIWEVETRPNEGLHKGLVATLPTAGVNVEDLRVVELEDRFLDFWVFNFLISFSSNFFSCLTFL